MSLREIATDLDLKEAVRRASRSSNLLPPRPDDEVGGEVGKRFSETLLFKIQKATYEPERAHFVQVLKRESGTRPAALLTLADRTLFDALVYPLRQKIEQGLLGPEIVFWPRGMESSPRWPEFEKAPLIPDCTYVVKADIAGFYEQIPHLELGEVLVELTGRRPHVQALIAFLDAVMCSPRGIPQGLEPSDAIATAYLSSVDNALARMGFAFSRYGDDYRISAMSYREARRALFVFEAELRERGLMMNTNKSHPMRRNTYETELRSPEQFLEEAASSERKDLLASLASDERALVSAINEAGLEQLGWDHFYHHTVSRSEVIDRLAKVITPQQGAAARRLFLDTIASAPGLPGALQPELFHQRLAISMRALAAAKDQSILSRVGDLVARFPEKMEIYFPYLSALRTTDPVGVIREIESVLLRGWFITGWQVAWLVRVLQETNASVSQAMSNWLESHVVDEDAEWIGRIEALCYLLRKGQSKPALVRRLYNSCPSPFRADLISALGAISNPEPWVLALLNGASRDPVHLVVRRHAVRSHESGSQKPS